MKIFQAKGKGSETWRRESVRSYDRKFDSNLPLPLSLSFHRWIRLLSRSRPDKLSSSGRKQVFVFLRPRRENSINPVAALIERDRIRPRVKDRADTDCAILIYSWGKKGLAFVQFPIRGTSLPMQRWNRERERSTRLSLSLSPWISFRIYQPMAVSYTSLPRDRIFTFKTFSKKKQWFFPSSSKEIRNFFNER